MDYLLNKFGPGKAKFYVQPFTRHFLQSNQPFLNAPDYKEFETTDVIGFPLLDCIQSTHVLPQPLVPYPRPSRLRGMSGSGDEIALFGDKQFHDN